jgi:hypothetical protein
MTDVDCLKCMSEFVCRGVEQQMVMCLTLLKVKVVATETAEITGISITEICLQDIVSLK